MKNKLIILILGLSFSVFSQDNDTVFVFSYNFNRFEVKENKIKSYSDSINNFNGKNIPKFLLNRCLEISDEFVLGQHPIESIRWKIIKNVNNLTALKQILFLKEKRLNKICNKRKYKRYLSEIDLIELSFEELIKNRIDQLEYIANLKGNEEKHYD